jgi:hypothetical protein
VFYKFFLDNLPWSVWEVMSITIVFYKQSKDTEVQRNLSTQLMGEKPQQSGFEPKPMAQTLIWAKSKTDPKGPAPYPSTSRLSTDRDSCCFISLLGKSLNLLDFGEHQ